MRSCTFAHPDDHPNREYQQHEVRSQGQRNGTKRPEQIAGQADTEESDRAEAADGGNACRFLGAFTPFKALYIDKREFSACAGRDSNAPLGSVSLTENVIMIVMGIWMPLRMYVL